MSLRNQSIVAIRNLSYSSLGLIMCLYLSWHALLSVNFFYGFWHDNIGIAETIAETGPQNRYRSGFEKTDREQRIDLFEQICTAITHQGKGLEHISYSPEPNTAIPLLHKAEIVHLQDVANLISVTQNLEPYLLILWLILLAAFFAKSWPLPTYRQLLGVNSVLIIGLSGAVLAIGWVEVFYAAHRWIFPDDHQWFFFYQESLMSTMMQAPDLFLYIGISMFALAVIAFISIHEGLKRIPQRKLATSD
ncbi:DUF1461 domain-containing protein [Zhongshania sp.]|uniref:lipoprotein intramolecular transacylase Lit n=1 Tax=Zhongshania sp. TaxID=1971902 RepID=UPI001B5A227A|nr:DUF1461 domain-containing protein [Zhongshania sp.]MBQ0797372.1 DUF1461 domain-containing protein [Zhongshania sp.]